VDRAAGTVKVEGGRQLRKTLKQAGDDLTDLRDAHREAASIASAAGGASAPRQSGRLAGSVRGSGTKTASVIRAGRASVPYAQPIHWGWPKRNIAANPWLSEAAQRTEPQWTAVFESAVDRIIARVRGA